MNSHPLPKRVARVVTVGLATATTGWAIKILLSVNASNFRAHPGWMVNSVMLGLLVMTLPWHRYLGTCFAEMRRITWIALVTTGLVALLIVLMPAPSRLW